ncbi:MAG: thiol:disulfide interchange protein DsbA/DsbL [Gammaproteobacteria bacterium]
MRRLFALTIVLFAVPLLVSAQETFIEGQHYERVSPAVQTGVEQGIEVVEVFWYGCPHCFEFEPHINEWKANKADDVIFRRIPAIFNQNWVPHARAYYAAEVLGVLDIIHPALFKALHEKRHRIYNEESLRQFFIDNGVSGEDFDNAYNSPGVDTKTRQAMAATRDYGITGVPAMIVNGRFWTSARLTGDFEGMLKAVEHLADKERAR